MPNPSPKTQHLVSGRTDTDVIPEPLDLKGFNVRVTPRISQAIRALPNKAAWLRRVVTEAAEQELLVESEK